jgi:hypothetical protein
MSAAFSNTIWLMTDMDPCLRRGDEFREKKARQRPGDQIEKLDPQPQPEAALGLVTRKAAPPSDST